MDARQRLYLQLVAEEVASAMRHRVVNKIAAVGALTFHLRRQLPPTGTPPSALAVLPMIDGELAQASQALDLRFLGPQDQAPAAVDLAALADGLLSTMAHPPGVELVGPGGGRPAVAADAGELDLALFCLLENAIEAVGPEGKVSVRLGDAEPRGGAPMVAVEVTDDGPTIAEADLARAREAFFTTKPGRLGLGLNVAVRIAQRWRGGVELARGRRGVVARLLLPAAAP